MGSAANMFADGNVITHAIGKAVVISAVANATKPFIESGANAAMRSIRTIWAIALTVSLAGCSTNGERATLTAQRMGFTHSVLLGENLFHTVYRKSTNRLSSSLHVYIEGDGRPWLSRHQISPDPTPNNPLMLRLMYLDANESVYVGRPCYYGLADSAGCKPTLWTDRRYSKEVVASMASIIRQELRRCHCTRLNLFGHSGGGTLAMLLAEHFPETEGIVTLAGNLDPAAWTAHHGYSPLEGSLNPARRAALNSKIVQLHLAGSQDQHVPPDLIEGGLAPQMDTNMIRIEGFTHACCWERIWPDVLESLRLLSAQTGA